MKTSGIILCAGSATRMGFNKLTKPIAGHTAMERSMDALILGGVDELVLVVCAETEEHAKQLASEAAVPVKLVQGGTTRGDSVYQGILASKGDIVVIHDGARCMVSPETVAESIVSAQKSGSGIAAIPVADTVYRVTDRAVPMNREELLATQTPQTFRRQEILRAYESARQAGVLATDDAAIWMAAGHEIQFVPGSITNRKLTRPEDFSWMEALLCQGRVGFGVDTHILMPERKLVLGGVTIPYEKGLLGHSDADVLIHAVMDAMLGAAALGDIGHQFPDTDDQYKDISSMILLQKTIDLLKEQGLKVCNIDATIMAEKPKLAPYIPEMRKTLAQAMQLPVTSVSIKATTTEGVGPEGEGLCITAQAVAFVTK